MERSRPIAPPAQQVLTAETMPFKPGQVIGSIPQSVLTGASELTDSELAILLRGGYRDGDPLPDLSNTAAGAQLRKQIVDVVREAEAIEGLTPVDPTTPALVLQPNRDITTLDTAERAKATQAFRELNELQTKMQQARDQVQLSNDMPEHMATIPGYLEAMATTEAPTIELVDDIGLGDAVPRMRKKQPATVTPAPAPVTHTGADLSNTSVICPRCQFDLNGELFTPTRVDKVSYMALVMDDTKRFRRKMSLFGGRIIVVFRSLLTSEDHLAMSQVDEDAARDRISNLVLYAATLDDYKMIMSIESVQRKGKPPVTIAPINDYEFDDKKSRTALPEFRAWLDDEVLTSSSIRRAVSRAYYEFSQIMHMCEAHAPDSDFFAGIG